MPALAQRKLPPSDQDAAMARTSAETFSRYVKSIEGPLTLRMQDFDRDAVIQLPVGAVALLAEILTAMASGHGIAVIPEHEELTTSDAADVLNISRPFLIKLLDDGVIPHRKVGKHRRVRVEDVMAYKERDDVEREAILDQLAREAQEQDMGYRRE